MRSAIGGSGGAASDLLSAYSGRFSAVELDSVFYRRPARETVEGWADATTPGFRFSVRVPREITHVDLLGNPAEVDRFVTSLGPLGSKLGMVLFTTPPTFGCDLGRFTAGIDSLPSGVRTAWEFRHTSWMCPEVLELLAKCSSCPVIVEGFEDQRASQLLPGGTLADRWEFPFVYVRFRRESYTYADLMVWGDMLADVIGEGRDVYAFFRPSPEAPAYATALAELLAEAKTATFSQSPT
jgi:uncharacterized protein YecE (DUF72 family)